ncbi:MAG: 3-deoxy-7-phosphoheptulonate synthase, partial [Chitinophagia bacterium]|nr:3-deoxy-7-phosphoheptulonate synthase [Chitinophagia bacterium]
PLKHGISITDPCISFSQTSPLLDLLARAVRDRRARQKGA